MSDKLITFKEYYILKEGWLNKIQVALDVIGFEPTVGTAADFINAALSALRAAGAAARLDGKASLEHIIDSGISAISMIPFGDIAKIGKLRKLL